MVFFHQVEQRNCFISWFKGEDSTFFSEQLFGRPKEKCHWSWISCGSCNVMADFFNSHNHWHRISSASSFSLSKLNISDAAWRGTVLELLESRDNSELLPYCNYDQAVDKVNIILHIVQLIEHSITYGQAPLAFAKRSEQDTFRRTDER